MRRGLISWSREEVPEATLEARLRKLQLGLRADNFDAVLAYTSLAKLSAVAYLTHFVPYDSEAMLAVFPTGAPILLTSLTEQAHPQIRDGSHLDHAGELGEVRTAPKLGLAAAGLLSERVAAAKYIGVIDLPQLPHSVVEPLADAGWRDRLVDATGLFALVRQPADAAELTVARRALAIAEKAAAAIAPDARSSAAVFAAVDRCARSEGADEVIARIAPDLTQHGALERIEGEIALGASYALELSLAYKSVWVRVMHTRSGPLAKVHGAADRWFQSAAGTITETEVGTRFANTPGCPGELLNWRAETCISGEPLTPIAGTGLAPRNLIPHGTLTRVSAALKVPGGYWHGRRLVLIARANEVAPTITA